MRRGGTTAKTGHAVAHLVEALRYKPEGHWFDSRWYHLDFYLPNPSGHAVTPGVDSACNRNEYQGYFLGVQTAGADCFEIWEPQPPGNIGVCLGL
jgi:hypothetical protein